MAAPVSPWACKAGQAGNLPLALLAKHLPHPLARPYPAAVLAYQLTHVDGSGVETQLGGPVPAAPVPDGDQLVLPGSLVPPGRVHTLVAYASNVAGEGPPSPGYRLWWDG